MKTKEFISILKVNKYKELLFEYVPDKFAGANYHLTEVKNVTFETVDCGGSINDWKETHLQLWESPNDIEKDYYITTDKAADILDRVNGIRPLWLETELKVEFGNADFHTSVMSVSSVVSESDKLIIQLFTNETGCKASDVCGVSEVEVTEEEACCSGSSCC